MNPEIIQTIAPLAAIALTGVFFLSVSRRTRRADPEQYRRAKRLTSSYKSAVLGSVGSRESTLALPDVDCGMVSREINGQVTIARQARLTQDAVASI
jgi:hypothetical protein